MHIDILVMKMGVDLAFLCLVSLCISHGYGEYSLPALAYNNNSKLTPEVVVPRAIKAPMSFLDVQVVQKKKWLTRAKLYPSAGRPRAVFHIFGR